MNIKHNWQFWRFERVSKIHWGDDVKVKEYLTWVWEQLKIKRYEDWYAVTNQVNWFYILFLPVEIIFVGYWKSPIKARRIDKSSVQILSRISMEPQHSQ